MSAGTPNIEASALVSEDGLMIASALPQHVQEVRVAGMSSTLLSLGMRAATELGRGNLEQVLVRGKGGYILMTHAGEEAVVTVVTKPHAKLGLIFLDVKRAAEDITRIL